MFLELFWPKEIKELVAKYRTEGTLNEEALNNINRDIKLGIIIGLIAFGVLLASSPVFASSVLIFSVFSYRLETYLITFDRVFAPYAYGSPINVRVKKVTRYAAFIGKVKVVCESVDKAEQIIIGPIYGKAWEVKDHPNEGEIIKVWRSEKGKKYAMPDIDYMKKKYSLTTAIL